jgi:tetratricopeptide (TPR) repeat protein
MKKLFFSFLPVLILFIAVSCTENPTEVENFASADTDLYNMYLEKSKLKPLDISFEQYKDLYERKLNLRKNVTNVTVNPPPGWVSDYGENLDLGDDGSANLKDPTQVVNVLPPDFVFRFYGVDYDTIYVNSNGNLTFTKPFPYNDIELPSAVETPLIAVLASDFDPRFQGMVAYKNMIGTAPNRIIVVTWVDVPEFYGSAPNTFQAKLFEGSNRIQFSFNGLSVLGYDLDYYGDPDPTYPQEVGISAKKDQIVMVAMGDGVPALDGESICLTPTSSDALDYTWEYGACGQIVPPDPEPDPSASEQIAGAGSALEVILAEGDFHKKLRKDLEKAIKELGKSLDPKNWLDEDQLDPKKGKKVFDHLKKAVKELEKFEKNKDTDPDVKLELDAIIESLVSISREFAQNAIAAVDCTTDKCSKELEKALKEMNKAEEEYAKGHWDHAIDDFGKAWEHAMKALKHIS